MNNMLQPEDSKRVADAMIAAIKDLKIDMPAQVRDGVAKALQVTDRWESLNPFGRALREAFREGAAKALEKTKGGAQ